MGGRIVCIVGPTACGKTELSIAVAKRCDAEIISADSVQVYRGMDIGSAKPTVAERCGVPHHMLDCVEIDTPAFSVSQYAKMAGACIDSLAAQGTLPLVVGGSGLYIAALVNPLGFAVPADAALRENLLAEYRRAPEESYAALGRVDPATAARLHKNDGKRIVRALEVYRLTGKPLSSFGNEFQNEAKAAPPHDSLQIGLSMERSLLYGRINARVDGMMAQGLVEEAWELYQAGFSRALPAMQSIGYKQLFSYFDGLCTLSEATEMIKRDTRRFAKRQLSWFSRDTRIHWIDRGDTGFPEALERACGLIDAYRNEDSI